MALGQNPVGIRMRPFRKLVGNAQLPKGDGAFGMPSISSELAVDSVSFRYPLPITP
ncbi:MAG: hypothetical protein ACI8QF_004171 [Limisphaerales bacterium]